MILDSHVHFWKFDPIRDSWITKDMNVIQKDFFPPDLEPLLAENGVSGCIAVQADQSETETDFLLALAEENSFIKGVVGWIDLRRPDIDQKLESYSAIKSLKGFRQIAEGEAPGFLVGDDFVRGVQALKKQEYTYDILIKHHQLQEAIILTDKVPGQAFVIDHCAKPELTKSDTTAWANQIKVLAQNPDVYCKLSGLLTQCNWQNRDEKAIFNCLDLIFEHFGTGRVMFGSDWPVMLLAGNYNHWIELVTKYTGGFTPEEKEHIFFKNTACFYNL